MSKHLRLDILCGVYLTSSDRLFHPLVYLVRGIIIERNDGVKVKLVQDSSQEPEILCNLQRLLLVFWPHR